MSDRLMKGTVAALAVFALLAPLAGCSSMKRIKVVGSVQAKERIDQEVQGPAGNWQNAPAATANPNAKTTRDIFVIEVYKEPESLLDEPAASPGSSSMLAPGSTTPSQETLGKSKFNLFNIDEPGTPAAASSVQGSGGAPLEYTVEKDDTLQKIAKKFYNSSGKWPRIYEANKDIISNPDHIKPGIVLKIPQ